MGTEISWLLPAALIGLIAGVWFTAGTDRTGRVRAHLLLWGGWLLVSGAVFSFMHGVIHPYYTVALAPAIAALIGISVRELWRGREFWRSRTVLAAMSAATGVWAFILLDRTRNWLPRLRWTVLIGSIALASVLAVGAHRLGQSTTAVAVAALLFGVGAPPHTRSTRCARPDHAVGRYRTSGPGRRPRSVPRPAATPTTTHCKHCSGATETRWAAASVGSMACEQPGASDRRVGDGDRRVHRV